MSKERSLKNTGEDTKMGLNIKVYKLQSWVSRLVRILLVEIFETYWHLATFYIWHCRNPSASLILMELWNCFKDDIMWEVRKSERGWNMRVSNLGPPDSRMFQDLWSENSVLLLEQLNKDCSDIVKIITSGENLSLLTSNIL